LHCAVARPTQECSLSPLDGPVRQQVGFSVGQVGAGSERAGHAVTEKGWSVQCTVGAPLCVKTQLRDRA
jgi:hypothetical protein